MKLLRVAVAVSGAEVERAITAFELCGVFNSAVEWEVGEPVEEPAWGQSAPLPERADVAAYLPDESWARIAPDFAAVLAELWPAGAAPQIVVTGDTAARLADGLARALRPGAGARIADDRDSAAAHRLRGGGRRGGDRPLAGARVRDGAAPEHVAVALAAGRRDRCRLCRRRVLDLGTGSGILACAAAKLGARSVLGVDIDPLAVDAARETARRNQVERCG